jgi:AcrR family transcriptional regulator
MLSKNSPASPPPHQRRKQRGRRRLAEAAVRLASQYGFANVTVEQIADAADYSASTFFRHFKTKEDAVFFDVADQYQSLRSVLEHEGDDRPAWDRVREVILDSVAYWADDNSGFAVTRTALFLKETLLYKRYLEISAEYESIMAGIFAEERGVDANEDFYSRVLAGAIVGAFRTSFHVWSRNGGSLPEHLSRGLNLIEAGLQPHRR